MRAIGANELLSRTANYAINPIGNYSNINHSIKLASPSTTLPRLRPKRIRIVVRNLATPTASIGWVFITPMPEGQQCWEA
jgi:hypothetical protein